MAIKDSIVNLKKGLRTTLTNVPALIDTLIRGLDGVEEEIEKGEVYNTDEHVVGTWIDGSEIYEKVYRLTEDLTLARTTWTTTTIDISTINEIIDSKAFKGVNNWGFVATNMSNGKLQLLNIRGSDITINTIILRYTKISASRSPEENDTKNGNEEKNER